MLKDYTRSEKHPRSTCATRTTSPQCYLSHSEDARVPLKGRGPIPEPVGVVCVEGCFRRTVAKSACRAPVRIPALLGHVVSAGEECFDIACELTLTRHLEPVKIYTNGRLNILVINHDVSEVRCAFDKLGLFGLLVFVFLGKCNQISSRGVGSGAMYLPQGEHSLGCWTVVQHLADEVTHGFLENIDQSVVFEIVKIK